MHEKLTTKQLINTKMYEIRSQQLNELRIGIFLRFITFVAAHNLEVLRQEIASANPQSASTHTQTQTHTENEIDLLCLDFH